MSNVIDFPDPNAPDGDCVFRDADGKIWYKYSLSYMDGDKEYSFHIWALSAEDAARRMKLPMKITGQVLSDGVWI